MFRRLAASLTVAVPASRCFAFAQGQAQGRNEERVMEKLLPEGWERAVDESLGGRAYYVNKSTGETTWDVPTGGWCANWDGREGQQNTHKGVKQTILLVRHGQYESAHGRDSDELALDSQRVLTPLGREQAALTGKRIEELVGAGIIPPIDSIVYSTMTRATETFRCILEQLSTPPPLHRILASDMLREGAVTRPIPSFKEWKPTDEEFDKDGKRVEAAFCNYIHRPSEKQAKSSTSVLVCHGNVIRYILLRVLQYNPSGWCRLAVYNASITRIDVYQDGHISVYGVGDVGHLPAQTHVTYS